MSQYVAHNLEQAREFLQEYCVKPVTCINGDIQQECQSIQEAEQFFNPQPA